MTPPNPVNCWVVHPWVFRRLSSVGQSDALVMRRSWVRFPQAAQAKGLVRAATCSGQALRLFGPWSKSWSKVALGLYGSTMAKGYLERLKSGSWRANVDAGRDPITGKRIILRETHPTKEQARAAKERLLAQVEAERVPDKAATVAYLLDRRMEVADHELSTESTNKATRGTSGARSSRPLATCP